MRLAKLAFKDNVMAPVALCECGRLEAYVADEILYVIETCRLLWAARKHPVVTVTSLADGKHSKGSFHYKRPVQAVDLRTFDLPGGSQGDEAREIRRILVQQLKPLGFDVVLEATHIHIEYDPD